MNAILKPIELSLVSKYQANNPAVEQETKYIAINTIQKSNIALLEKSNIDSKIQESIKAIYDQALKNYAIILGNKDNSTLDAYNRLVEEEPLNQESNIYKDPPFYIETNLIFLKTATDNSVAPEKEAVEKLEEVIKTIRKEAIRKEAINHIKQSTGLSKTTASSIAFTPTEISTHDIKATFSLISPPIEREPYQYTYLLNDIVELYKNGEISEAVEKYKDYSLRFGYKKINRDAEIQEVLHAQSSPPSSEQRRWADNLMKVSSLYNKNHIEPAKKQMKEIASLWQNDYKEIALEKYNSLTKGKDKKDIWHQQTLLVSAIEDKESWATQYIALRQESAYLTRHPEKTIKNTETTILDSMKNIATLVSQGKQTDALQAFSKHIELTKSTKTEDTVSSIINDAKNNKDKWISNFIKIEPVYNKLKKVKEDKNKARIFIASAHKNPAAKEFTQEIKKAGNLYNSGDKFRAFKILDRIKSLDLPRYSTQVFLQLAKSTNQTWAENFKKLKSEHTSYSSLSSDIDKALNNLSNGNYKESVSIYNNIQEKNYAHGNQFDKETTLLQILADDKILFTGIKAIEQHSEEMKKPILSYLSNSLERIGLYFKSTPSANIKEAIIHSNTNNEPPVLSEIVTINDQEKSPEHIQDNFNQQSSKYGIRNIFSKLISLSEPLIKSIKPQVHRDITVLNR